MNRVSLTFGRLARPGFLLGAMLCLAVLESRAGSGQGTSPQTAELPRPPAYIPPPLNPKGVVLETRRLDEGVYALLANTPFTDNGGFVVGRNAVLVIDSQFNGEMARQIIAAVRRVTDLPIRYLVNTSALGDHVLGNYAFPTDTEIVGSRVTVNALQNLTVESLKQRMAATVANDMSVFEGTELRLPTIAFDEQWTVDLGGRRVEARFFGPGMSPSDTVVYVPEARVAWTGNLIFGAGTIPWAQSGNVARYRDTLRRFADTYDVRTIVPGHGALTTGESILLYDRYLAQVQSDAAAAVQRAIGVEQLIEAADVPAGYSIAPALRSLMKGFHQWNLQRAFVEAKR
jgi:cyclase